MPRGLRSSRAGHGEVLVPGPTSLCAVARPGSEVQMMCNAQVGE